MFVANTGQLAINFLEEGISTHGTLTKSVRRASETTAARARAVNTITGIAGARNEPIGVIVNKVLRESIPELQSYVQARGEAPSQNPITLAIQSALLRTTEIAMMSKALDTTDDDALLILEDSEQQHKEDNTMDSSGILSPDAAAGIALLVGRIAERFKQNTGNGNLSNFITALKAATNADNFTDISCCYVADNLFGAEDVEDSGTSTTATGGSFWDNLFDNIDEIVDGVTKVTTAVNTTVGNVQNTSGGIIDQINNIGGGIGAASIEQYLAANWLKVVGVIIAIIILTIILIRANRN